MRDMWFASDHHYNHGNIIRYCNRPFASVDEMNEAMIERHNSVVKDGDVVYYLGDVYFGHANIRAMLARLKGRKRLILGNHDNGLDQNFRGVFSKILAWRHFREFGLLLTHVPVHPKTLNEKTPVNVHGHTHDKNVLTPGTVFRDERYVNVSVEQINYTPVNVEELRVR